MGHTDVLEGFLGKCVAKRPIIIRIVNIRIYIFGEQKNVNFGFVEWF